MKRKFKILTNVKGMRLKLNENNDVEKVYSDTYTAHIKRKARDNMDDNKRKNI